MSKEEIKRRLEGAKRCEQHASHAETRYWCNQYKQIATDALAEQPAQQEPTKAMIDAAERIDWSDSDVRGNIVNMWQAMCAVAPQPHPAQQEQVAWECKSGGLRPLSQRLYEKQPDNIKRHYTRIEPAQPARGWVGLTKEDKAEIVAATERDYRGYVMALVEAKLKDKNSGAQPAREPLTAEQMANFLGCRYHTMSQSELEFFRLGEAAHGFGTKGGAA